MVVQTLDFELRSSRRLAREPQQILQMGIAAVKERLESDALLMVSVPVEVEPKSDHSQNKIA